MDSIVKIDAIELGLNALARTKVENNLPWFFGHVGASLLAAQFLIEDNELSTDVNQAINEQIGNIVEANKVNFCAPIEERGEALTLQLTTENILKPLKENIVKLSTAGHGVIFGVLALKAFNQRPELCCQKVVEGICTLLTDCTKDIPNRYYGIADYNLVSVQDMQRQAVPDFKSIHEAGLYVLTCHSRVYPDYFTEEHMYFLAGDALHDITFAHALFELDKLGFRDLAVKGLPALRKHIWLSGRELAEFSGHQATRDYDPREIQFWQRSLEEPHHIKLAHAVLGLLHLVDKPAQEKSLSQASTFWDLYQ